MPILSFDEIQDWNQYEELVAAFFRCLKNSDGTNIANVTVKLSGSGGPDGGKDIIVDFVVSDYIMRFSRRWLIQCKFMEHNVSPGDLFGVDIPTLVHSEGACGYLLICKNRPTTALSELFKNLNNQSRHYQYTYEIWSGEQFKEKLYSAPFPIYVCMSITFCSYLFYAGVFIRPFHFGRKDSNIPL